jgi:hypothetical protein
MGLIVMSDLGGVDLVVLGMRSEELDKDDLGGVVDGHDQPVGVAFDIEDDALVADDARGPVLAPNSIRTTLLCRFDFLEPSPERILRVAVSVPRGLKRPSGNDPHRWSRLACSHFGINEYPRTGLSSPFRSTVERRILHAVSVSR